MSLVRCTKHDVGCSNIQVNLLHIEAQIDMCGWVHGMIIISAFRRNAMHSPGYLPGEERKQQSWQTVHNPKQRMLWLVAARVPGNSWNYPPWEPLAANHVPGMSIDDSSIPPFHFRDCLTRKFCRLVFTIPLLFFVPHYYCLLNKGGTQQTHQIICAGFLSDRTGVKR
jgi:hypothetical protein